MCNSIIVIKNMHISLELLVHKCKNNIEFIIDTKAFKSDRMGKKFEQE